MLLDTQTLALASGIDLSRINPYASDHDQKLEMANQLTRRWMSDPENRAYLNEKKADYIHDRGRTVGGNMKHELDIPTEVFIMLPPEIRNDKKELWKWAQKHQPQLFHSRIV